MIWVKLKKEEQKKMLEKKRNLKSRKKRFEDLISKERKIRWKLEDITRGEERKANNVDRNGKIRINEKWWRWDEEEEMLRDEKGNRGKEQKKDKEEKKGKIG